MALNPLSIKFSLNKHAFSVFSDNLCNLLRIEFACKHGLNWEEDAEKLSTAFFCLVFLSLQLLEDCPYIACCIEEF
jgi:hypothetical protein